MQPIPKQKHSAYKTGPNKMDQLKIKALASEGVEASEISHKLKIQLESVKGWMPKKKKKVTKKKEV